MLQAVEQRIDRVINNLLPATFLEGKFGSPKTLYEQLARYRTPGISIAVINDFAIEWARGFGGCEAGTIREVEADTLFQAASISKPVFALAVMHLVQEGCLSLDEDVNTYLTSWRVPAIDNLATSDNSAPVIEPYSRLDSTWLPRLFHLGSTANPGSSSQR